MATQTFKIKNGLTLTPVDPSTLTNPQAGDLVCDSTDNNQIKRYNATSASWVAVGSGSGPSDLGIVASDSADSNSTADYTQTGLEILVSPAASALQLIHGTASYRLVHQAASTRSFKKTIAVDSKFRGRTLAIKLWNRSTATSGNDTLLVRNETAATDLLSTTSIQNDSAAYSVTTSSGQPTLTFSSTSDINSVRAGMSVTGPGIQTGSVIQSISGQVATMNQNATASATISARFSGIATQRTYTFFVPDTCASLSWTISALAEANSPESYYDDIVVDIASAAKQTTTIKVPASTPWASTPTPNTAITNATFQSYRWRQQGQNVQVEANAIYSGAGSLTFPAAAILPAGMVVDVTNITAASADPKYFPCGKAYSLDAATADYTNTIVYSVRDNTFAIVNQTNAMPFTAGNLDQFSIVIDIPIVGLQALMDQTIELTSSILIQYPDSLMRLAMSGLGSGPSNKIVTFSGPVNTQSGNDFTWVRDSVNGDYFQCNRTGSYTALVNFDTNAAGSFGISVDSVNLTTAYDALPTAERAGPSAYAATGADVSSFTLPFQGVAGSKYRVHMGGSTTFNVNVYSEIVIQGQKGLTQLNPSSDQKIELPTHEVRFEGSSARGSTDTAIVKFDNLAKMRGDAFSIVNTAANGTVITIQKDGLLSGMASVANSQANRTLEISINQQSLTSVANNSQEVLAIQSSSVQGVPCISFPDTQVRKGDVIRVAYDGTPSVSTDNIFSLMLKETKIAVALSNVSPIFDDADAVMEFNTLAANGSTYANNIRFANMSVNDPKGKLTYTDSVTDGASVRVNEAGAYFITMVQNSPIASLSDNGITKNEVLATTGNTPARNMSIAQGRIAASYVGAAGGSTVDVQATFYGWLNKNDVIRFKGGANTPNDATLTMASIVKVGKPSLTAVDVTPFLNLKTSAGDVGEVTTFASATVPADYLICDGSAVSRSKYSDLFAAIGTAHGTGDGSTTFNLPDYRGMFLRMTDGTKGNDPDKTSRTAMNTGGNTGNAVGSIQGHAMQNHQHRSGVGSNSNMNGWGNDSLTGMAGTAIGGYNCSRTGFVSELGYANSSENRPINAYVTYGVRWRGANPSIISQATSYRMSDYLATGTRVTGVDPANLGEYRVLYRPSAGSQTQSDASTPAILPSVANGMYLDGGVPLTSAGSATSPQVYRIFIGKNKRFSVEGYNNTGRSGGMTFDRVVAAATTEYGVDLPYDPSTGVLEVNAANFLNGGNTTRRISATGSLVGYFDVYVYDSPYVSFPRIIPNLLTYTTGGQTGTYVPSPGCLYAEVEICGGGGGGGNGSTNAGAGGGAGGYQKFMIPNPKASGYAWTIGTGGNATNAGTASTFGNVTCNGGSPGLSNGSNGGLGGSVSGTEGITEKALKGGDGASSGNGGTGFNGASNGGTNPLGCAGGGVQSTNATGRPGTNGTGSGGGGGQATSGGGGKGGDGGLYIKEYFR